MAKTAAVTPCVGVWIETLIQLASHPDQMSHPAWVCGLKPETYLDKNLITNVTPCVGVWIETFRT